jgi:hypothetical protein
MKKTFLSLALVASSIPMGAALPVAASAQGPDTFDGPCGVLAGAYRCTATFETRGECERFKHMMLADLQRSYPGPGGGVPGRYEPHYLSDCEETGGVYLLDVRIFSIVDGDPSTSG